MTQKTCKIVQRMPSLMTQQKVIQYCNVNDAKHFVKLTHLHNTVYMYIESESICADLI